MGIPGDGLNGLPTELLGNIFRLAIGSEDTKQNRCKLMLVCRRWQEYVEESAFLWTDISAYDGVANMRRSLERSKGAMLDLCYWFHNESLFGLEGFMVEARPHIARWRSLVIGVNIHAPSENLFATLKTTQIPSLEMLKVRGVFPSHWISRNIITLFDGASAPPTLKELSLWQIPVAIEPLKLSGLVSLHLGNVPTVSAPQLLEILNRCPSLETLILERMSGLGAIGPQASNIRPIELPKLDSLTLKYMDHDGANCIISNIRIPNRRRVLIHGDSSGASALFTPTIAHLLDITIPTADILSSVIIVEKPFYDDYTIKFRGIEILLDTDQGSRTQSQEILRWLANGLGSEAAECPVHLILDWSPKDLMPVATVPPPLIVKHLSISDSRSELLREAFCIAMVQPPDPTCSGWIYPQLESLSVRFQSMESQGQLVSMLRSRYEGASVPGETESRCPASLRSVELRGSPRIEGLVEGIKGIPGEANVFWAEEETSWRAWVSAGD